MVLAAYLSPLKADPDHFHRLKHDVLFKAADKTNLHIVRMVGISQTEILSGIVTCLEICQRSNIKDILIEHISMLFITVDKQAELLKYFYERDVSLHIAHPQIAWPPQTLKHFFELLMGGLHSLSLQKSNDIIKGIKRAKRRGVKIGQNAFGLLRDEQDTVDKIISLHKEGLSLAKICEMLQREKIRTRHQKKWYPMTIQRIIKREQERLSACLINETN